MEIFKLILKFITSFFENRTVNKQAEVKKEADAVVAVVETIRANTNAAVVVQQAKTQEALVEVQQKQVEERAEAKAKPDDDSQFGSEW